MILVDGRVGSVDLIPLLTKLGVGVSKENLPFSDVCFEGNGESGRVFVGIERKRVTDLINSMRTGRLVNHQLDGMSDMFSQQILIVEGLFRPGVDGLLEIPTGKGWQPVRLGGNAFMFTEVDNFLTSLQLIGGIPIKRTSSPWETAHSIVNLYRWYQKPWEKHSGHLGVPKTTLQVTSRASLVRRVAKELPGIGWGRSQAVAEAFTSVVSMANATKEQWESIDGIGPKTANSVWAAVRGRLCVK